jgi:CrcB protein
VSSNPVAGAVAREPLSAIAGVALGGAVGTLVRYLVGLSISPLQLAFPLGTLLVNVAGSFVIGAVMFLALERTAMSPVLRATLATGFCGGLTTFSSFALETYRLFETHLGLALLNLGLQLGLGLAAVRAGAALAARFAPNGGAEP